MPLKFIENASENYFFYITQKLFTVGKYLFLNTGAFVSVLESMCQMIFNSNFKMSTVNLNN